MKKYLGFVLMIGLGLSSCENDGCTDETALNYDPKAETDDGSCVYLAENINLQVYNKLGTQDFEFNVEVLSESGRRVKFTRAQMYMSKFTFNGTGGAYELLDPHVLVTADEEHYPLGYLPLDTYTSFTFAAGVDSISNHADPASFPSTSALSSNNINHMHWGWNSGYIFYVLEGMVDTSANMTGDVNAPFIFHVGLDKHLVDLAFVDEVNPANGGDTISLQIDWLRLLDGTDMTAADSTRSTHTMNNPSLAELMVSNVDEAISLP